MEHKREIELNYQGAALCLHFPIKLKFLSISVKIYVTIRASEECMQNMKSHVKEMRPFVMIEIFSTGRGDLDHEVYPEIESTMPVLAS